MILDYFDINQLAQSGQTFRWYPNKGGYVVVHRDQGMYISQAGKTVDILPLTEADLDYWLHYLDQGRDYGAIRQAFMGKNDYLDQAMAVGHGIRVLNQDAYEMLVTFMISANNNMKRIKASVSDLAKKYGRSIFTYEGETYYAFPTSNDLRDLSVEDYRACGLGYRDKYLHQCIQDLNSGLDIESFKDLGDCELLKALMTIKGVGQKVANCVILFGYQRRDGFPIDTWIRKVLLGHFDVGKEDLQAFAKENFPYEGGLAQQYLFYYGAVIKK